MNELPLDVRARRAGCSCVCLFAMALIALGGLASPSVAQQRRDREAAPNRNAPAQRKASPNRQRPSERRGGQRPRQNPQRSRADEIIRRALEDRGGTPESDAPADQVAAQQDAAARPRGEEAGGDAARLMDMLDGVDPAMFNNLIGAEIELETVGDQMIIQGPADAVASLELLIQLLDGTTEQKLLEVVQVSKRDANEIANSLEPALREVLFEPNQRAEDEVTVTALSPTVLLVGALPKHIDFVLEVIEQVDQLEEELPEFEQLVFDVKNRRAADVATQLTDIIEKINQRINSDTEIQVIPNNANNTLLVIAPEEQRERIQLLIDTIDVEPATGWGDSRLTIYPLIHSQANDLADVIENILDAQTEREAAEEFIYRLTIAKALPEGDIVDLPPINLQKPTRIIPDTGTNSLMVATAEENIEPMGELIRLLDGVPTGEELGVMIRPLRFADAENVRDTLETMFDKGKTLPQDPDGSGSDAVPQGQLGEALVYNISVAVDVRTNTLIVSGRQEQLSLVEMIVNDLDQPANALKFPLQFITLEHTDATSVSQVVTELFDQRFEAAEATGAGRAALERERVFLSVDIRSNSLVVSASEENFAEISGIVSQLDTKPARLFEQIRIVACGRLAASELKTKIEELWQRKADLRREEELLEDLPIVVVDDRSNSLIIASSVEDFDEIQRLITALEDQPRVEDIEMFELQFADAVVVADMVDQLFQGMAGQSETFAAPTVLADPRANALMVAGSQDAMDRVRNVIGRVDVKSGPQTALFKVYPLEFTSSSRVSERMQELFDSRSEGGDSNRTPIVILAEETSNSLVASASRADHDVIADLLKLLDRPSSIARQFEIFPLKMAKAANVADRLEELFQAQSDGGSGRADAIATVADERTNSIVVWAAPSEMANVAEIVSRLDTSSPSVEMMIKVVQLKQALAEDFAQLLEEVLIGEGGGDDDQRAVIVSFLQKTPDGKEIVRKLLRQDITVQADPRTNSLMVLAPADSIDMLEAMIRDFDRIRPVTSELRLFQLINSDAETMVDQLSELFGEDAQTGGDGETASQLVFGDVLGDTDLATVGQDLRFAADPRTNTLLAAGSPVYLTMIEDLVRYLDSQEAEDRVHEVYQAKFRPAQDLAQALQGFTDQELSVIGEGDDAESAQRRQDRQVSVEAIGEAEEGSSLVMVGTSRNNYQRTMKMIQDLDRPEPQVSIKVLIAEVTVQDDLDLGVEIAGQDLDFTANAVLGPNGVIMGDQFDYVAGTDLGASTGGLGGFSFTVTGEDFSFLFRALQQNSRLEVLSQPTLTVRNGEEGNITIADQVPVITGTSFTDSGQSNSQVGREDVGIIMTATPHISPDGYVTLELEQEISTITGENVQLTETVSQPQFSTREVRTNVTVRDGETVVIGGLIQTQQSDGESKVPILGDIPWLGWLFRTTGSTFRKTELLVVLTVDIMRDDEDLRNMSVHERDMYELPDSIVQSPLMRTLRIKPSESALGGEPVPGEAAPMGEDGVRDSAPVQPRDPSVPKTRTYGPVISKPATPTSAEAPVYGPKIARREAAAPS